MAARTHRPAERAHGRHGPRCARRARALAGAAALIVVAACGARGEPAWSGPLPNRPLEAYARLGLVTGGEEFPAVGGFATVAGPRDSTWLIFGLTLPTSALRFHRDGDAFAAGYHVELRFRRGDVERAVSRHGAQVRVATFEETGRTDESIVYQDYVLLEPGTYVVDVSVTDSIGTRGLAWSDTLEVTRHGPRRPALLLVHEATPRTRLDEPPRLVLNSRHSAEFGGERPPLAYVEAYTGSVDALDVVARDAAGASLTLVSAPLVPSDAAAVRALTVELPIDSLPLGPLTLVARDAIAGAETPRLPLLITISDRWMVANYEEVLDYLVYIASSDEIERLREAETAAQRRLAWDEFWERRDPVPASPANEYREGFFERVRAAAEQFAETGRPGWRTDRGRVYIVLGPPHRVTHGEIESRDIAGAFDAIEWRYERERGGSLTLVFIDRDGFGRFQMTRSSELAFRSLADRMRVPD